LFEHNSHNDRLFPEADWFGFSRSDMFTVQLHDFLKK